jgi:glycosyltransferase 2 family protein
MVEPAADEQSIEAPPNRARALAIAIARGLASVLFLVLLVRKVPSLDADRLFPQANARTFWWLSGALLLSVVSVVLSAWRWQQVLAALGLPARASRLLRHYLAGLFVGNVLPSTIGGDVLRVTRLSADNGERPASFASVVLERLTGWVVLPLITLFAFLINPGLRHLGAATTVAFTLSITTLVLLVLIVVVAVHPALRRLDTAASGWQSFAGAVRKGLEEFRKHPGAAANMLGTCFVYQLAVVMAALMAANALDLHIGPTAMLAFMPAVAIAQALPISLSGLGVREGAFVLFLTPLGVATDQAIALGLLVYLLNLAVSLLGAPAFAVGGSKGRHALV